jgi:hypothetical protein
MHEKYAKDGLVIVTVTVELSAETDKERAEARASVEDFLAKAKPPFRTVNLDIDPKKPPATLNFGGEVPGVVVFNRDGRYVLKLPEVNDKGENVKDFDYDAVEKAVIEALKKK